MENERESWLGLVPTAEFRRRRETLLKQVLAHRGPRRFDLGPLSVVFENRQTVAFQIQEVMRLEGAHPARVIEEYAELIPRPGELTATLFVCGGSALFGREVSEDLRRSGGQMVRLRLDHRSLSASAPGEIAPAAAVHYLRFSLPLCAALALRGPGRASLEIQLRGGSVERVFTAEQRHALALDLAAGFRAGPAVRRPGEASAVGVDTSWRT